MLRMLKDRLNIPGRSGSRREDRENLEDLLRRTGSPAHPSPWPPSSPGSPERSRRPRRAVCPVRRPRRSCQSRAETRGMPGGTGGCPGPGDPVLLRRPGRLRSGPAAPPGPPAMTASPLSLRLCLRLPASVLRLPHLPRLPCPQRLPPPVLVVESRAEAVPSSRWLRPRRLHRLYQHQLHRQHQRRIGARTGHIRLSIRPSIQPSIQPSSAPTRALTCAPLPPSAMPMTSCVAWRSSCAAPGRRSSTPS